MAARDRVGSLALKPTLGRPTLAEVRALLARAELPTDDLTDRMLENFLAVYAGGQPVALGGAEVFGTVALLRSVATIPERQCEGFGGAVLDAIEQRLRDAGVSDVYLLTETAASYFARRGYHGVARAAVPTVIAATEQYAGLCPDSAVPMHKALAVRPGAH